VRLGVLGWPVAHSRSPAMHNAALRAVGLTDWRYQLLPVVPELLDEVIPSLGRAGFRGANVTIPHKAAALALATDPTERAAAIGAANTLTFEPGGEIVADNTDAPALIAALPFDVPGRSAVVLGAGGSARAVVWALADELGATALEPSQPPPAADILVNCTSVGLDGGDPFAALPLSADGLADYGCVVDLVYTAASTGLIVAAAQAGAATVDGLEILVGQGALSFERFTGLPAPLDVMRAAARG
jgi:shikimate dehydrogenase